MIKGLISTTTRLASALFIVSTIAACGGGGGSDSGSGFIPAPPPEGANLDVTLGDANGNTITEITPLKAGLFRVVVTTPDGNPLPQEVVKRPPLGTRSVNRQTDAAERVVYYRNLCVSSRPLRGRPRPVPGFFSFAPSMRPVSKTGPTYRNILPLQRLGGALAVCRDDSGSMMM